MIASEKKHIKIGQTTTSFDSKKKIDSNKKQILSNEKLKNSGNCIYDYIYAH